MRVLVQRSLNSSVTVDNKIVGSIDKGLVLFVGFTDGDTSNEIDYLVKKVINLRIFDDENGVMNKSILDVGGEILSISQFTLFNSNSSFVYSVSFNIFITLIGLYLPFPIFIYNSIKSPTCNSSNILSKFSSLKKSC